jgi:hypothetical protein
LRIGSASQENGRNRDPTRLLGKSVIGGSFDIHYELQLTLPEAQQAHGIVQIPNFERERQWFKDRAYRLAVQQDTDARLRRFSQDKKFMWLHFQGARRDARFHLTEAWVLIYKCIGPGMPPAFPIAQSGRIPARHSCIMYLRARGRPAEISPTHSQM